jgi:hypothetical protein
MARKTVLIALILLQAACASGRVMTRSDFASIELGAPVTEVTKKYGEPLKVTRQKDGSQVYEYIERLPIGTETVEENNYKLVIKNGQVVSKKYNQELPPAYDEIYDEDPNDVPN